MPRIFRLIGSMGVVAISLAWGVVPETVRADDCLTQPNSSAPQGNHWYYRTDRATQRKCWYLRAPDQPAEQPAAQTASQAAPSNRIPLETPTTASVAVPISVTPEAGTSPQPHVKMLSVVGSAASDKLDRQSAEQGNTSSITAPPAPEESVAWPDPPTPLMTTVQDRIATPTVVQASPAESVQPAPPVRPAAGDAEDTAQPGAPTNSASQARVPVVSEPVKMILAAVLGLMVAGFLYRLVMIARRPKIIVNRSEHWIDDRNEHALRDRQTRSELPYQWNGLINDPAVQPDSDWTDDPNECEVRDPQKRPGSARRWDKLTDDLHRSVTSIPTISDYKPRPARNDYVTREKLQYRDRDSDDNEIGKREDMFEQLRRDLDQLLRSPKVA